MKIPIDPLKLVPFVTTVFKLWCKTIRFEVVGDLDGYISMHRAKQPMILAAWHGDLFSITGAHDQVDTPFAVLVSQSKDGEFISRIIERLGETTIRGSSSRGGVKALIKAKKAMVDENRVVLITMDGPRGPRHKAKDGIIFLAQKTGAKIIPIRTYPKTKKVFEKSWDKFNLPYPFSRSRVCIGDPMEVTEEKLDKGILMQEKARLEKRMRDLK